MLSQAEQKYNLIRLIFTIENPAVLEWLERELKKIQRTDAAFLAPGQKEDKKNGTYESIKAATLKKGTREKFDPEEIKQEQGWKGQHDKEEMMRLIHEMDIQEPIELLLSQLTK